MKISSKGRYAVRILIDLATSNKEYSSLTEISKRQNISVKYLEKIINILLKGKLVESMMGPNGGYKLTKKANEYSVADVLIITGDAPLLAPCQNTPNACPNKDNCISIGYWQTLQKLLFDNLNKITIQDIIDKTY